MFLKPLSVVKKVGQSFSLLVNKVVKLTEAFKYAITSVPLAVEILNPILHPPDRAGLRKYIINLPRSSSQEYLRSVNWEVDGLAAIRSVPPRASNEEWLKTFVTLSLLLLSLYL